ncbi:MAG: dimethylmenaquinone methyltransferase [Bacteroidota bacterium]
MKTNFIQQFKSYRQSFLPALVLAVLLFSQSAKAQLYNFSEEQMTSFTATNPFGRFLGGRPMIPEAVLDTFRQMQIQVVEAVGSIPREYANQYEAGWKTLQPGKKLYGRAFTVQFIPSRPDLVAGMQSEAKKNNFTGLRNQTTIDMLQKNDLVVVDLFGKVQGGTYVGDKLAYYIWKTTETGVVVDGGIYLLENMAQSGMQAFYRGTYPGPLSNATVSGINVPVRIGNAIIMPGDLIIGDQDGILAVPPQYVSAVIRNVIRDRRRDVWMKKAFDLKRFKSSDIYGRPKDPELLKQFEEYLKTGDAKLLPK